MLSLRVVAGSLPILGSQALQEGGEPGRARLKGREQLVAQTDAYGNRALRTVRRACRRILRVSLWRAWRRCCVPVESAGDPLDVSLRTPGQVGDDIADLPPCARARVVPGSW